MNPHVEFFGQIAIKNRLVTPEEVEDCLAIQKKMKGWGIEEPLGEILLDKGYLARDEVEDLLEIQSRMRPDEHQDFLAFRDAIGGKESVLLGELILLNQLVPPQAVEESLRIQKDLAGLGIKKRIGEILIARKLLDPAALVSILRVQAKWLGRGARTPGFRFPVFRLPLATAAAAGIVLLALILFLPDRMGAGRAGWDGDTPRAENDPAREEGAPGVRYSGAGMGLTPPDLPPPGSMVAAGLADHAAAVDSAEKARSPEEKGPEWYARHEAALREQDPEEIVRLAEERILAAGPEAYARSLDERNMTPEQVARKRRLEQEAAERRRQAEEAPPE